MIGEPKYYKLLSNVTIPKKLFHPIVFADSNLISYQLSDLNGPNVTPICQYYYSGIKRYIMGDNEYSSFDINKYELDKMSNELFNKGDLSNNDFNGIQEWLGSVSDKKFSKQYSQLFNQIERGGRDIFNISIYKINS